MLDCDGNSDIIGDRRSGLGNFGSNTPTLQHVEQGVQEAKENKGIDKYDLEETENVNGSINDDESNGSEQILFKEYGQKRKSGGRAIDRFMRDNPKRNLSPSLSVDLL